MPTPDDQRFRPDDPTPDDYPAGEGYPAAPLPSGDGGSNPFPDSTLFPSRPVTPVPSASPAPRPVPSEPAGDGRDLPYGATGSDESGSVYGAPPVAGPVPPGTPRYGWQPAARRARQTSRATWGVAIVVLFLLLSLVARACSAIVGDDDSAPDPSIWTQDPAVETSWVVTPADIDPTATGAELALGLDGAFTGRELVDAGDVLVVGYGVDHTPAALAGLDRSTGQVLWHRDAGEALCGDQAFDGSLACVMREDAGWVYHRLDVLTGEDLATAETDLETAVTVHAGPQALIVVGAASPAPHAPIVAFGPDGAQLWQADLAEIDGAEHLFDDLLASDFGNADDDATATLERPRWRDLDEGLMMLWSSPGVALIDPGRGVVVAHECLRATPAHDRYFCQDDAGINRRDLDGTVVWSLPDLDLVYPDDTSDARPVAVSEVFEIIPVDWETGEVTGPAIHRFDPQPGGFTGTILGPSAAGDAQSQYLIQDGEILVKLDDDADEVDWVFQAGDDDSYLEGVFTIGGVSVIDSYTMLGLERASGEELWRVTNARGLYPSLAGDGLITIGFDEIVALELP